jgi:hypothetical protein
VEEQCATIYRTICPEEGYEEEKKDKKSVSCTIFFFFLTDI